MDDERIIEQGQHLSEELAKEQQRAGRWRCPVDLRTHIVTYAVACSAEGESHRRIADRLGMTQRTLSRWIRKAHQARAGVRAVAIVPAEHRRITTPAPQAPLRLVSPHGYVIEGLDPEVLVSLLQVLG